jgi:hypothetical protein
VRGGARAHGRIHESEGYRPAAGRSPWLPS